MRGVNEGKPTERLLWHKCQIMLMMVTRKLCNGTQGIKPYCLWSYIAGVTTIIPFIIESSYDGWASELDLGLMEEGHLVRWIFFFVASCDQPSACQESVGGYPVPYAVRLNAICVMLLSIGLYHMEQLSFTCRIDKSWPPHTLCVHRGFSLLGPLAVGSHHSRPRALHKFRLFRDAQDHSSAHNDLALAKVSILSLPISSALSMPTMSTECQLTM